MTPRVSRVFIRARAAEPGWQVFPFAQDAPDSADIKIVEVAELIRRKPEFLNFAEQSAAPFRVAAPISTSFGLSSPILVAVDEMGGIFLVGCPDESGPNAYRTVVADVLAASTRLWRMSYEQFSQIFTEVEGASLEELMLLRSRADWDFDQFEPTIAANLEKGRFPILIVTAHPTGEVRQVLDYLKGMNLVVAVVSYSIWVRGGILVVEPVSPSQTTLGVLSTPATFAPPPTPPRQEPPVVQQPVEAELPPVVEEEKREEEPTRSIPAGALPTEPAKTVAKPPGPGTRPGVMAGKRPPPKPKEG